MSVVAPTLARPQVAAPARSWLEHAHEWIVTVDHKRLGIMYVVAGLVFFLVAGVEAALMRLQLAWPELHVLPPETFNRLFTMHGTTMVFLVGIPIVFGFGKHVGKPLAEVAACDRGYLEWMLRNTFLDDVHDLVRRALTAR